MSISNIQVGKTTIGSAAEKPQLSEKEKGQMSYLFKEVGDLVSAKDKLILEKPGQNGNYQEQQQAIANAKAAARRKYEFKEAKTESKPAEVKTKDSAPVEQSASEKAAQKAEMRKLHQELSKLTNNPTPKNMMTLLQHGEGGSLDQRTDAIKMGQAVLKGEYKTAPTEVKPQGDLEVKSLTDGKVERSSIKRVKSTSLNTTSGIKRTVRRTITCKSLSGAIKSDEAFVAYAQFKLDYLPKDSQEAKKLEKELKQKTDLDTNNLKGDFDLRSGKDIAGFLVLNKEALQNPVLGSLGTPAEIAEMKSASASISRELDKKIATLSEPEKGVAESRKAQLMFKLAEATSTDPAVKFVFDSKAYQNPHLGKIKDELNLSDMVKNKKAIEAELNEQISKLTGPEAKIAQSRKIELMKMINYAEILTNDKSTDLGIKELVNMRLAMKEAELFKGISTNLRLPTASAADPQAEERAKLEGVLVDEKGVEFGNIRKNTKLAPNETVMGRYQQFCSTPGHGNIKLVDSWTIEQSSGSWKMRSCAMKHTLEEICDYDPLNTYKGTEDTVREFYQVSKEIRDKFLVETNKLNNTKLTKDDLRESIISMMALNMELFDHLEEFPGFNKEKGTITIYRTETDFVKALIDANGANTPQAHYSSGCVIAPVVAEGTHAYKREVPLHRLIGLNFVLNKMFNDYEKEFLVDFSGIEAEYMGQLGNQHISSQPSLRGVGWSVVVEGARDSLNTPADPADTKEADLFQNLKDMLEGGGISQIKKANEELVAYRAQP